MDRNTLLELIPAYALDVLDDEEHQAVAALLETDAEALQLLQEYQAVADAFVLAVPARQAPPTLRAGLQQRLAERRTTDSTESKQVIPEKSKIRPFPRLWVGIGAAAAVFLVLIIGFVIIQQQTPDDDNPRIASQELYYRIVDAEGSHKYPIDAVAEGVQGDLVISSDGQDVVLRLAELPTLGEAQSYQLWALDDEELQSVGIYHWPTGHGPYYVKLDLAKPIDVYQRFGMTIEPEEGSPLGNAPTGEQVWGLALVESQ